MATRSPDDDNTSFVAILGRPEVVAARAFLHGLGIITTLSSRCPDVDLADMARSKDEGVMDPRIPVDTKTTTLLRQLRDAVRYVDVFCATANRFVGPDFADRSEAEAADAVDTYLAVYLRNGDRVPDILARITPADDQPLSQAQILELEGIFTQVRRRA